MSTSVGSVEANCSIEQLEGNAWPEPSLSSYVARGSAELRRKSLGELHAEDLRLGLEQQIGIRFLVPLALDLLEGNPLLEVESFFGRFASGIAERPKAVLDFFAGLCEPCRAFR